MKFDREIQITTGQNRKSTNWIRQSLKWSDFVSKLSKPIRTEEKIEEFLQYNKSKQTDLKDVGGFVAGTVKDGRRRAESILTRCIVALDADNIEAGQTDEVLKKVSALGCAYAVYSTRKHTSYKPRLRILIPLDVDVTADKYEAIARKIASFIGMQIMDNSTFEASRLMFWPSCSKDSEFVFVYEDKPFANAEGILGLYKNWQDAGEWPKLINENEIVRKEVSKQKDPLEKENIIGAFCRVYDIPAVIDKYLSDVYVPGDFADKYTYSQGSVANGATVYGDGKWLYSYHATDPASRTLCNSFDLVRIHKFRDLDDEAKEGTPQNRLPSYSAMCKFALEDKEVSALHKREKYGMAKKEFSQSSIELDSPETENSNWVNDLIISTTGGLAKCAENALLIIENDPALKDKLIFDRFTGRFLVRGKLPWDYKITISERTWDDDDDACLRNYLDKSTNKYGLKSPSLIKDAICELKKKKSTHVVQEYFKSLQWDGIFRVDSLLIDYLGADDNLYTRDAIRKELVAAVARVVTEKPVKFDNMIILTGPQGIGKSTFLDKLGKQWFSDNIKDFNNKDTLLQMQKCLIIEIGELQAFNRADINVLKQFMSQKTDTFRAPYDRETKEHPRHCVFFGTTNESEFLKDKTGNRRFWPIECHPERATKDIFKDLTAKEVDQIWAEAIKLFEAGESLYLTGEAERISKKIQGEHLESHPWEGPIKEFVLRKVSTNWLQMSIMTRESFGCLDENGLIERDRICAAEIWCECLGNDLRNMKQADSKIINSILGDLKFEDRVLEKVTARFGVDYGTQRGFKVTKLHSAF